jgi:hypothetical protein
VAETSEQETIKQHTVPQCYLREFADGDGHFYRFNKKYGKSKRAPVSDSAQSERFYDQHGSALVDPNDGIQWVEKEFSKIEKRYREVLDGCFAELKTGKVSEDTLSYLAQHLTMQWLRTKGARDIFVEADAKFTRAQAEEFYKRFYPTLPLPKLRKSEGYDQALHANIMFDRDIVMPTAEKFFKLIWVFGRNTSGKKFYTSDEPLVWHRTPADNEHEVEVPPAFGLEFAFPLNSEYIVVMLDPAMYRHMEPHHGTVLEMNAEDVERFNTRQVRQSTQYVFCFDDDFELARKVCDANPEICDPARQRVDLLPGPDGVTISIKR